MPVDSSVELCALYGQEVTLGSGVVSYKALGHVCSSTLQTRPASIGESGTECFDMILYV